MKHADVLILGGGIAGISAALASARNGADTVLIEKQCILGGLATAGLITIYLPLDDGMGTQLSYGIAEELLHLSMKHGYQDKYPRPWLEGGTKEEKTAVRYRVQYNPFYFALECEKLLKETGVEIMYDTRAVSLHQSSCRITSVTCANDAGIFELEADSFIDASGNACMYSLAGERTISYQQGNILAGWYYSIKEGKQKLHMLGVAEEPDQEEKPLLQKRFNGVDDINEFLQLSHAFMLKDLEAKNEDPSAMAMMPDVRMIRHINAEKEMHESDSGKHYPSSIGMAGDWRKHGPHYEIPYESLFSRNIENLYACGRIIGCDEGMWDIMRVIPCCAVTGEAAGTAAAISRGKHADITSLQQQLHQQGQKLFFQEVYQ